MILNATEEYLDEMVGDDYFCSKNSEGVYSFTASVNKIGQIECDNRVFILKYPELSF